MTLPKPRPVGRPLARAAATPPVTHLDEPEISIILPIYDERENLPPLLAELHSVLSGSGRSYELLLVDDGSTDGSADFVRAAARASAAVTGILFERNSGQSAALAAGFRLARGEILVTLDADGQNDPADIPRLLEALEHADVVSGVRVERADGWRRKISSSVANRIRRAALGDHITDTGCSLKAYRRRAIESLPFFSGAHRFLAPLCEIRGARIAEVPVRNRPRLHGRSKYGVGNRLFRGLRDLLGVRWLRSRLLRHRIREVIHG